MKRIIYLITALLATTNMASAQVTANSRWYNSDEMLTCESESNKGYMFNWDWWGEGGSQCFLTKTSENHFSVDGYNDDFNNYIKAIKDVEYKVVEGHKLLLFKDAKGNILKCFEQSNNKWEKEAIKGYHYVLDGTYVDETGVQYAFNGENLTMGGNKYKFSIDPEMYFIIQINDAKYWWKVSTTGINLYNVIQGEYGSEQGEVWHKLREISPNGRWTFLSNAIVPSTFMWRYPSGMVRIIRNEIYARRGYVFNSADLKNYFSKQPWYKPLNNNAAIKLNDIEALNAEILKANETIVREGSDDEEIEEGL